MTQVSVDPVSDEDLDEFSAFLIREMQWDVPLQNVIDAFAREWCDCKPNNGFVLRKGAEIVGCVGAIYSSRELRGQREHFCNITGWTVMEEFRTHSLRLGVELVQQQGFHYTNFTSTAVVAKSLKFLKFREIDAGQISISCRRRLFPRIRKYGVTDNPKEFAPRLSRGAMELANKHSRIPWLKQIMVSRADKSCLVFFKIVNVEDQKTAIVLGTDSRSNFASMFSAISESICELYRVESLRVEARLLNRRPLLSTDVKTPRRMFKSESLADTDIDRLCSEVVAFDLPVHLL